MSAYSEIVSDMLGAYKTDIEVKCRIEALEQRVKELEAELKYYKEERKVPLNTQWRIDPLWYVPPTYHSWEIT